MTYKVLCFSKLCGMCLERFYVSSSNDSRKYCSKSCLYASRKGSNNGMHGKIPWNKGKEHSIETKLKISNTIKQQILSGKRKNPIHYPGALEKMRESRKGKGTGPLSEEHKRKISYSKKGVPNYKIRGDKNPAKRPEVRDKISRNNAMHLEKNKKLHSDRMKNNPPMHNPQVYEKWLDIIHDLEYRKKVANSNRKNWKDPIFRKMHCGENASNWKGGISFDPYCEKFNNEFKERVREFFSRRCIICNKTEEEEGRKMSVHHVDYDKQVCCNDRSPAFVCVCSRHNLIANGNRDKWSYIFHYIISEIYDGKCYYTKDEFYNSFPC